MFRALAQTDPCDKALIPFQSEQYTDDHLRVIASSLLQTKREDILNRADSNEFSLNAVLPTEVGLFPLGITSKKNSSSSNYIFSTLAQKQDVAFDHKTMQVVRQSFVPDYAFKAWLECKNASNNDRRIQVSIRETESKPCVSILNDNHFPVTATVHYDPKRVEVVPSNLRIKAGAVAIIELRRLDGGNCSIPLLIGFDPGESHNPIKPSELRLPVLTPPKVLTGTNKVDGHQVFTIPLKKASDGGHGEEFVGAYKLQIFRIDARLEFDNKGDLIPCFQVQLMQQQGTGVSATRRTVNAENGGWFPCQSVWRNSLNAQPFLRGWKRVATEAIDMDGVYGWGKDSPHIETEGKDIIKRIKVINGDFVEITLATIEVISLRLEAPKCTE